MLGARFDQYRAYKYALIFEGKARAGFHECVGLILHPQPRALKLPGRIGLKWGVSADPTLWLWHQTGSRLDGRLVVRDLMGVERFRFAFSRGWAATWTGPGFNAAGSNVSIETLVLAHEGIDLED